MNTLKCEWCHIRDKCRFMWIDNTDLPCHFCSVVCMRDYIFWGLARARVAQLRQDRTEQDRTE